MLLRPRHGYRLVRQKGGRVTVTETIGRVSHGLTVLRHRVLQVGTLSGIVAEVAAHLGMSRDEVRVGLFAT